jgi:plasmid stabilization system protein ParE
MSSYTVSPEANQDLFQIWRYLAQHGGIEIANRVEAEIYEAFEALCRVPGPMGSCLRIPATTDTMRTT